MKRLDLPKIGDLPKMVLFHRDHPAEPRVVLQIPNEDRTDAETYVLRMDRPSDVVWLNALKGARSGPNRIVDLRSAPRIVCNRAPHAPPTIADHTSRPLVS